MKMNYFNLFVLVLCVSIAGPAYAKGKKKSCQTDGDCRKGKICVQAYCKRISMEESYVQIGLSEWNSEAILFIDGIKIGYLPWEGSISAGEHTVTVEAPGFKTLERVGHVAAGTREVIDLVLEPAPEPSMAPASESPTGGYDDGAGEDEMSSDGDTEREPGMLYVGFLVNGGLAPPWARVKKCGPLDKF